MEYIPGYLIGAFIFVLGLIIGSFLNVVIHRLPRYESVVFPASHCTSCKAEIKAYDNIPLISYVILGGRCRTCGVPISAVYPTVELLVALLYLLLFLKNGLSLALLADMVFVSLIVPLIFIDLQHKLLLNVITYPGLVVAIMLRVFAPDAAVVRSTRVLFGLEWPDWAVALLASALGALAGGGSLWLVREVYFRLRRVEGMGLGDVKMMLMVGGYLGWQLTLLTVFLASLLGSLVGLMLIAMGGGSMKMEIPFGVFLGAAAILSLFFGQQVIDWYLGFYTY